MSVSLDPVELDGKFSPEDVVAEVMRQNPAMPVPVPVEDLAHQAGISEINPLTSDGFEGMLVVPDDTKSTGAIFYNVRSIRPRQRFTIAHELGHFLLPTHKQPKFECTSNDMVVSAGAKYSRKSLEAEANRFASELLLPARLLKPELRRMGEPNLRSVRDLSEKYETSVEATARRFTQLSEYPCAVVFSRNNVVRYALKSKDLPYQLEVREGSPLPHLAMARKASEGIAEVDAVMPELWLKELRSQQMPDEFFEQVFVQENGYAVTLLYAEDVPDAGDEDDDG
jgi:hypothetical protein